MLHKNIVVGPLQCNCAILACERTLEAIVIDPGDEAERILKEITAQNLTVKYVIHTHAHFDHIGATGGLKQKLKTTLCLHKDDEQIYNNLPLQGKMFGMEFEAAPPIEKFILDEEILTFGEHQIQVIHTPGHSPGGVCLKLVENDQFLFSGDTLFQQSVGRSDLWGGNHDTLIRSIKTRLLSLDGDTRVFPGHGPSTRIGDEKKGNPFLI